MAHLSRSVLRELSTCRVSTPLRASQRRWAQIINDVRFLATSQAQQRILEKYRDKLDRKAKEEGLKDIAELKEAYKQKISELRTKATIPKATAPLNLQQDVTASQIPFDPPPPPQSPTSTASSPSSPSSPPPGVKTLDSFLDVPKALRLPQKEIEAIWRLRHASSPTSLVASIPNATFDSLAANGHAFPQFILPLPREGQGSEIHFLQWTFPTAHTTTILFTYLAEYKLRGEFASPHTTVTFHSDIAKEKGLVLVQGAVVEGRGISVEEGKWLLMVLQKFYGMDRAAGTERRRKLLEAFSKGDSGFSLEKLIEEAEKVD
ncbi:ATP11-domain-containing protein [Patellaria atrata CBS 101060]|uniref:ATP11-domain-containing protein n=1 Tax=Patellaria atrata CBS 101060 TaxID=1346257 RepID=A0A9P4SIF7_9PEZI|nr:ATP11-domain-containing protein [Patellaria atrata CBS 101060]